MFRRGHGLPLTGGGGGEGRRNGEAVPRTPWLGYGIQPVSGPLTPCTEGKTPVDAPFRAVKPRIGNRCTASGDLYIRMSGINRVLFS